MVASFVYGGSAGESVLDEGAELCSLRWDAAVHAAGPPAPAEPQHPAEGRTHLLSPSPEGLHPSLCPPAVYRPRWNQGFADVTNDGVKVGATGEHLLRAIPTGDSGGSWASSPAGPRLRAAGLCQGSEPLGGLCQHFGAASWPRAKPVTFAPSPDKPSSPAATPSSACRVHSPERSPFSVASWGPLPPGRPGGKRRLHSPAVDAHERWRGLCCEPHGVSGSRRPGQTPGHRPATARPPPGSHAPPEPGTRAEALPPPRPVSPGETCLIQERRTAVTDTVHPPRLCCHDPLPRGRVPPPRPRKPGAPWVELVPHRGQLACLQLCQLGEGDWECLFWFWVLPLGKYLCLERLGPGQMSAELRKDLPPDFQAPVLWARASPDQRPLPSLASPRWATGFVVAAWAGVWWHPHGESPPPPPSVSFRVPAGPATGQLSPSLPSCWGRQLSSGRAQELHAYDLPCK
ncbi:WAS/WASL-interacting protein family member 1-like [Vulpes lagopus]|uniref:WAS/WASL-interacting protein family member 1-like n=1 Tax=Vulpes lagopus TaxID=494514 RepID=UPI001BC9DF11|nr:WAS/WASL-interacting protein family member 1-like [Vulpes lagopus]